MLIRISESSGTPIYRQIADGIRREIAQGRVESGDRLPPARDLAEARSERDHHKRLLGQLQEQYAVFDAERVKFATQLSENSKLIGSRTLELQKTQALMTKYKDKDDGQGKGEAGSATATVEPTVVTVSLTCDALLYLGGG